MICCLNTENSKKRRKNHEKTFRLDEEFETVNLLSKIAIENYKKKYRHNRFRVT